MDDILENIKPDAQSVLVAGTLAARLHPGLDPARLFRLLRRGSRLTQKEVAERAGVRQARVSDLETGRAEPRWREFCRLLKALGRAPYLLAVGAGYQAKPGVDDVVD